MAFNYDTWAASWGSSWAGSWGQAPAVVAEDTPSGLPAWLKKKLVESHIKGHNEEKRKKIVKRLALLLME